MLLCSHAVGDGDLVSLNVSRYESEESSGEGEPCRCLHRRCPLTAHAAASICVMAPHAKITIDFLKNIRYTILHICSLCVGSSEHAVLQGPDA